MTEERLRFLSKTRGILRHFETHECHAALIDSLIERGAAIWELDRNGREWLLFARSRERSAEEMKATDEHREGSGSKGHHAAWVTMDDPDEANIPHKLDAEALADLKHTVNAPATKEGTAEPILDAGAWAEHLAHGGEELAGQIIEDAAKWVESPAGQEQKRRYVEWWEQKQAAEANMPHEFQGIAEGTADRDCTLCNRPDRDPIHDAVPE